MATLLLHTGRETSTEGVDAGRKITDAEVLRARRDDIRTAPGGWALDRRCEVAGARWVYDTDPHANAMHFQSMIGNTALIIESEMFGQPTLRAKWKSEYGERPGRLLAGRAAGR